MVWLEMQDHKNISNGDESFKSVIVLSCFYKFSISSRFNGKTKEEHGLYSEKYYLPTDQNGKRNSWTHRHIVE